MNEIDFTNVATQDELELVGTEPKVNYRYQVDDGYLRFKVGDGYLELTEIDPGRFNNDYKFEAKILDKDHNRLIKLAAYGHFNPTNIHLSEDLHEVRLDGNLTVKCEGNIKNAAKALDSHKEISSIEEYAKIYPNVNVGIEDIYSGLEKIVEGYFKGTHQDTIRSFLHETEVVPKVSERNSLITEADKLLDDQKKVGNDSEASDKIQSRLKEIDIKREEISKEISRLNNMLTH